MIGIGIYDSKKAEALTQLQQADINVKIASARVEEVKRRLVSLEEERNKLLRSRIVAKELGNLRAQIISFKISKLEAECNELEGYRREFSEKLEDLRRKRSLIHERLEKLKEERNRLKAEVSGREAYSFREVDDQIRSALALKAELSGKLEAASRTINYLIEQERSLASEVSAYEDEISKIDERIKAVQEVRRGLLDRLKELEDERSRTMLKLSKLTEDYSSRFPEIDSVNRLIDKVTRRLTVEESNLKNLRYKTEILSDEAERLEERRIFLKSALDEISGRISEKHDLIRAKDSRLGEVLKELAELEKLRDGRRLNLDRALRVVEKAKRALTGLQGLPPPEIEESNRLMEAAAEQSLKGIIGRLRDHVIIRDPYIKALESASEGWLDAIVTETMETSLSCFKLAKKMGLGPVKVIPLSEISRVREVKPPPGVKAANAADLVEAPTGLRPAVIYVLGDTLVTESRKEAFLLSLRGIRAVSIQGDLFKPDGGLKTGDYRSSRGWSQETMDLKGLIERL
ncbi:MAG: hypothetical protein ACP5K1_06920, partial [Candidatus Bathyarchaeia archaeon]